MLLNATESLALTLAEQSGLRRSAAMNQSTISPPLDQIKIYFSRNLIWRSAAGFGCKIQNLDRELCLNSKFLIFYERTPRTSKDRTPVSVFTQKWIQPKSEQKLLHGHFCMTQSSCAGMGHGKEGSCSHLVFTFPLWSLPNHVPREAGILQPAVSLSQSNTCNCSALSLGW